MEKDQNELASIFLTKNSIATKKGFDLKAKRSKSTFLTENSSFSSHSQRSGIFEKLESNKLLRRWSASNLNSEGSENSLSDSFKKSNPDILLVPGQVVSSKTLTGEKFSSFRYSPALEKKKTKRLQSILKPHAPVYNTIITTTNEFPSRPIVTQPTKYINVFQEFSPSKSNLLTQFLSESPLGNLRADSSLSRTISSLRSTFQSAKFANIISSKFIKPQLPPDLIQLDKNLSSQPLSSETKKFRTPKSKLSKRIKTDIRIDVAKRGEHSLKSKTKELKKRVALKISPTIFLENQARNTRFKRLLESHFNSDFVLLYDKLNTWPKSQLPIDGGQKPDEDYLYSSGIFEKTIASKNFRQIFTKVIQSRTITFLEDLDEFSCNLKNSLKTFSDEWHLTPYSACDIKLEDPIFKQSDDFFKFLSISDSEIDPKAMNFYFMEMELIEETQEFKDLKNRISVSRASEVYQGFKNLSISIKPYLYNPFSFIGLNPNLHSRSESRYINKLFSIADSIICCKSSDYNYKVGDSEQQFQRRIELKGNKKIESKIKQLLPSTYNYQSGISDYPYLLCFKRKGNLIFSAPISEERMFYINSLVLPLHLWVKNNMQVTSSPLLIENMSYQ